MKMQLWKKETSAKDALYDDIFTATYCPPNLMEIEHEMLKKVIAEAKLKSPGQKSNAVAVDSRNRGNSYFSQSNLHDAIDWYNITLCFAENGSENVCLAYANRSACFFHLKLFKNCLVDIQLAIEAGYPDHLKAKLINGRAECEKFISEGLWAKLPELKLSVEPDPMDPMMAKTIRVDLDNQNVGESLLTRYICCNFCQKKCQNLIPCENCVISLHCEGKSEQQHKDLHPIECDIKKWPIITNSSTINMQLLLVRSILLAVRAFSNKIDDLIECVEKTVISRSKSFKLPKFENDQAKYRAFLISGSAQPDCDNIPSTYSYYLAMMNQKGKAIRDSNDN